jgi:hypothetical protein
VIASFSHGSLGTCVAKSSGENATMIVSRGRLAINVVQLVLLLCCLFVKDLGYIKIRGRPCMIRAMYMVDVDDRSCKARDAFPVNTFRVISDRRKGDMESASM